MEVLLISDPKADKASAAMDVKVGHLSDPEDLQGLAHFCEHLMFMGTEKVCTDRHQDTSRPLPDLHLPRSTRKKTTTPSS